MKLFDLICMYLYTLLLLTITGTSNADIVGTINNKDMTIMKKSHIVGGYMPIPDFHTNERIQSIAQFVTDQLLLQQRQQQQDSTLDAQNNNNKHIPQYSFLSKITKDTPISTTVVQGSQQVVAGMNYQLTIVVSTTTTEEESLNDANSNNNKKNSNNIIGAFIVTVYDQFGQLSITNYGKELLYKDAKVLYENCYHFHEENDKDETNNDLEEENDGT